MILIESIFPAVHFVAIVNCGLQQSEPSRSARDPSEWRKNAFQHVDFNWKVSDQVLQAALWSNLVRLLFTLDCREAPEHIDDSVP